MQVVKHEDRALVDGQSGERIVEIDCLIGRRRERRLERIVDGYLAYPCSTTKRASTLVDQNSAEPGVEAVDVAQASDAPPRSNERVLCRITRVRLVAQDSERSAI